MTDEKPTCGASMATTETNEEYHADHRYVSSSGLKMLRASPRLFERRIIEGVPEPPKTEFIEGNAAHTLALEPSEFAKRYAICPYNVDARRKQFKDWAKDLDEAIQPLTTKQGSMVNEMVVSLRSDPLIKSVLDKEGHIERSIRWTNPETGVNVRCRCDKFMPGVIVDLKTIASIDRIAVNCADCEYALQRACYSEGVEAWTGKPVEMFVFIFIEKAEPYRCRAIDLEPYWQQQGVRHYLDALEDFKRRSELSDWSEPGESELTMIEIPRHKLWKVEN